MRDWQEVEVGVGLGILQEVEARPGTFWVGAAGLPRRCARLGMADRASRVPAAFDAVWNSIGNGAGACPADACLFPKKIF